MRFLMVLAAFVACLQGSFCFAERWVDAVYIDNDFVSNVVSDAIFNRLRGRLSYQAITQIYNCPGFRYNNGVLQSDDERVYKLELYDSVNSSTPTVYDCKILQLRVCTLITYLGNSLASSAVVQALAFTELFVEYYQGETRVTLALPVFECLESQFVWNDLTSNTIDNMRFSRSAENWEFPIFISYSPDGSCTVGAYLKKNATVSPMVTPILSAAQQQASINRQLPSCWYVSWLSGFIGGALFPWRGFGQPWRLYDGNNLVIGTYPVNGINGYIAVDPATIKDIANGDYDRGGQFDFSEYVLNKDMRDPLDDSPNTQEQMGDIIAVQPPSVEGAPDYFGHPVEAPSSQSVEDQIEGLEIGAGSILMHNDGLSLLRFLINPEGFPADVPLPRWQKNMDFHVLNTDFNIGYIDIDLNFLHEEPYWPFWQKIRAILVLCVYVMTFLACYRIYEKMLAFSN